MSMFKFVSAHRWGINLRGAGVLLLVLLGLLLVPTPALAHHAMGGSLPATAFEGFLAGMAHPIIGPDHFAFIVAAGLLAVTRKSGVIIPIAFVIAAMAGTGLHLAQVNLPGVELLIASSVLMGGLVLVLRDRLNTLAVTALAAVAGVFHGYAYGESVVGAEMTPLLAYLIGFTAMQLAISLTACGVGRAIANRRTSDQPPTDALRSAGLVICGVGLAFGLSQLVSLLFPLPGV